MKKIIQHAKKYSGDLYIKFSKASETNKDLDTKAQEKLRLWEKGDKKTLELWKKLNSWVYSGMQEIHFVQSLNI